MQQLQRVRFYPSITGKRFVREVQLQIVYAIKNKVINVYRASDDPYALEFEGSDEEREEMQRRIDIAMVHLFEHFRDYTLTYLWVNGLYVSNKPVALEIAEIAKAS